MAAPVDLCVDFLSGTNTLENALNITKTAMKLGYEGIAINKHLHSLKQLTDKNIAAMKLEEGIVSSLPLCRSRKRIRQYTRLTVVLDDDTNTQKLSQRDVMAYDILAVRPTSEKTFKQACTTLPVDIIAIDLTQRLTFPLRRGSIHAATERGIHFEICYSRMIGDDTARRDIITNAYELCRMCKGQNVIMSSGCTKMMDLRGPMDVANLTHLFGMDARRGKDSVTTNCQRVLQHAESRRSVKSVLTVDHMDTVEEWVVDGLRPGSEDPDRSTVTGGDEVKDNKPRKKKRKLDKVGKDSSAKRGAQKNVINTKHTKTKEVRM